MRGRGLAAPGDGRGSRRARPVPVAWRMLRYQPLRAVGAVAVIGAATALVFFLAGVREGVLRAAEAYAGQPGVDLWIARRGTENLIRSSSFLPADLAERLRADSAVTAAAPLLRAFVRVEGDRSSRPAGAALLAIGFDPALGMGGPPRLAAGTAALRPGEIVLDRGAAHRLGVSVGDRVRVNGEPALVRGLSAETNILATQMAFLPLDDLARLSGAEDQVSFVLVRLRDAGDGLHLHRLWSFALRWHGEDETLAFFSRQIFARSSAAEVNAGFGPVLGLIGTLGGVMAAAVTALLLYGRLLERRAELAVLLALGASFPRLAGIVLGQAAVLAVAGTALGAVVTLVLGAGAERWVPEVAFAADPAEMFRTARLVTVAALAGALLPVLHLRAIEPEEVFRS